NRRVVPASEIDRLRGEPGAAHLSARNRFNAIVTDVKIEGLMAQVEMVVSDPVRLVAVVTRDAIEELGLKQGMPATAIVKSTSVMVQRWVASAAQALRLPPRGVLAHRFVPLVLGVLYFAAIFLAMGFMVLPIVAIFVHVTPQKLIEQLSNPIV